MLGNKYVLSPRGPALCLEGAAKREICVQPHGLGLRTFLSTAVLFLIIDTVDIPTQPA